LWFTDPGVNKIGRITTAGGSTEFPVPTANSTPFGITMGPDGALWFTENVRAGKVGRITTAGTVTNEFPITTGFSKPSFITAGPDGNMWFTERVANNVAKIGAAAALPPAPLVVAPRFTG
jgi:virginiamycin B lyase